MSYVCTHFYETAPKLQYDIMQCFRTLGRRNSVLSTTRKKNILCQAAFISTYL